MDWPNIVFQASWLKSLSNIAFRRFGDEILAEEAATYVVENLSKDNWKKLKDYAGIVKPETYVRSISVNLIEEYARKKFGRVRAPVWLEREGDLWLRVWKMLCLERQSQPEVVHRLCFNDKRDDEFVKAVIKTIKARIPWCGLKSVDVSLSVDDDDTPDIFHDHALQSQSIDEDLDQDLYESSLLVIKELLENWNCPSKYSLNTENIEHMKHTELLSAMSERLELQELDKLIVRMAFQEGLKLKHIARVLNLPEYQPGRILRKVFERLSDILHDVSPEFDDIKEILRH